jgi:hypothetical protein
MVKKVSVIALAGLIAFPAMSLASGGPNVDDLERKIEDLSRQLEELKAQMGKQAEVDAATSDQLADLAYDLEDLDERSDDWDLAARFKFYGDFRARYDYYNADTVFGRSLENDSLFTNRFRLNTRVKATENVEFKGRLAMFKTWGMQSAFTDDSGSIFPIFDGNVTRLPTTDSALYVDVAYVNWNNIGGAPVWFSVGRRPTTDGPPSQIRMGLDERLATPVAAFNYAFDGAVFGYGYNWGNEELGSGKVRLCYGRGFEDGLLEDNQINDVDFAGVNWDVLGRDERLLNIQSFGAFNVFNYPNFKDIPDSFAAQEFGPRVNLGNIWHTDVVYQDKVAAFNYFVEGGWSKTQPNDNGMFNDYAAMAAGQTGPNTDSENGYLLYAGLRYDMDDIRLKLGAEYNYGSEYWIAFAPAGDDIYTSKLSTRGHVFELYGIYDIPAGEAISQYGRAFIRLGYQYYDYTNAGSGDWNMFPYDLGNDQDLMKLQMMGMDPVESAHQIYLTFEAYF